MIKVSSLVAAGLVSLGGLTFSAPIASAAIARPAVAASPSDLHYTCVVRSYSAHALTQMAARHITKADVVASVKQQCAYATYQPTQGNWLFAGSPAVVMSSLGNVVTAYWNYTVATSQNSIVAKTPNALP